MAEYSFDVVSKTDRQELNNALDAARKEITNRFDFKGAKTEIDLQKEHILLETADEMKMRQLIDIIQSKMAKRGLSLKAFKFGKFESNVTGRYKCRADIQEGLSQEQTRKISKLVRDSKIKVQVRIQGDSLRISGKNKDDLQQTQKAIRDADLDFDASFDNYR